MEDNWQRQDGEGSRKSLLLTQQQAEGEALCLTKVWLSPFKSVKHKKGKSPIILNLLSCVLVVSECASRSVHLHLCVGAVAISTSPAGDAGQHRGEGWRGECENNAHPHVHTCIPTCMDREGRLVVYSGLWSDQDTHEKVVDTYWCAVQQSRKKLLRSWLYQKAALIPLLQLLTVICHHSKQQGVILFLSTW